MQIINGSCIYGIWPWSGDGWGPALGIVLIIIQFFIPLTILVLSYGSMILKLSKRTNPSSFNQSHQTDTYQKAKMNVTVTFCIVAFFYIICWVQNETTLMLLYLGYVDADWDGVYFQFIFQMVLLNSTVNPVIYLLKSTDFQNALREFFGCLPKETRSDKQDTRRSEQSSTSN